MEQSVADAGEAGPRRVVLVGMMGAGKSTIGRALARRTGWRYVDNDELVRTIGGRDASEIRSTDGEDALHAIEEEAFATSLALDPPVIIGAAAAVVLDLGAVAKLKAGPFVVWLRARPATLSARIGGGEGRRVESADPAWIAARAEERAPLYAEVASRIVDVEDRSPDEIAELILDAMSAG